MTAKEIINKLPLKGMVALSSEGDYYKVTYSEDEQAKKCLNRLLSLKVVEAGYSVRKEGLLVEFFRKG